MNKKYLYLALGLLIVGSLILTASSKEQLQGAFSNTKFFSNPSLLTVSANHSEVIYLAWDEAETTLGNWRLKASQNLTINGLAFHIGTVNAIGLDDSFISNYFKDCTVELLQGTRVLQSYDSQSCYHAYLPFNLEAGQSYSLTLKAKVLPDVEEKFFEEDLDGNQVALSFVELTKYNASQVRYTDSEFLTLVSQKESNTTMEYGNPVTFEYTFGGYILKNGYIRSAEKDWTDYLQPAPTDLGNRSAVQYEEKTEKPTAIPNIKQ